MATTELYTLSLHDALPIFPYSLRSKAIVPLIAPAPVPAPLTTSDSFSGLVTPRIVKSPRSEEHTSELQSHHDLVCRLLLEKKNEPRQKNAYTVTRSPQRGR